MVDAMILNSRYKVEPDEWIVSCSQAVRPDYGWTWDTCCTPDGLHFNLYQLGNVSKQAGYYNGVEGLPLGGDPSTPPCDQVWPTKEMC
jgi:hypothetical protein